MSRIPLFAALAGTCFATACAVQPLGPTARVMPAPGKPFEVFAQDQAMCKQFADGETDGGAIMSNVRQLGAAAVTTALGAGVRGGRGAGIGAALGAIGGAAIAGRGSARDGMSLQGRYDLAYAQCMFARGNQVAGMARAIASAPAHGPGVSYAPELR